MRSLRANMSACSWWRRLMWAALVLLLLAIVLAELNETVVMPIVAKEEQRSCTEIPMHRDAASEGLTPAEDVVVEDNQVVFRGYGDIVRRAVVLPNGHRSVSDIWIAKHLSVVVFVWDIQSSSTTLIKEYHPGPNVFLKGTVAGMFEAGKHSSVLEAARAELAEEAQLETELWYPLLESDSVHMPYDKYSNHKFIPFLAVDCRPVMIPPQRDHDEYISIERNVSLPEVMSLIGKGKMNVVSTYTTLLALRKLQELNLLG